jgi:hypothetical protein
MQSRLTNIYNHPKLPGLWNSLFFIQPRPLFHFLLRHFLELPFSPHTDQSNLLRKVSVQFVCKEDLFMNATEDVLKSAWCLARAGGSLTSTQREGLYFADMLLFLGFFHFLQHHYLLGSEGYCTWGNRLSIRLWHEFACMETHMERHCYCIKMQDLSITCLHSTLNLFWSLIKSAWF